MGKLGEILGDDFENEYETKRQKKQEERRQVSKEVLMEICYQAIHAGGFDGEEPRFTFSGEEVDHDVVLMESPRQDIYKFRHEFDESGGVSLGMFHMSDLWSCIFNEEMVEVVDKIEEDEYYLVVGRYQENIQDAGTEDEEKYINISPVRGILPLETAKKYADKYKKGMEGSSIEEQAESQKQEADEYEDDEVDLGGLKDDEEDDTIDRDTIIKVFKTIGNEKPDILQATANGDSDAIDKLVAVTNQNLDQDVGRERILDIFEEEVEEIDGRGEEEEDDEGIDLGGLGDDEDNEEEEAEDTESSDDEDDDSGPDVKDWF